ncbi:hypothetical protein [Aureliella helgolandensis]|uniref:hypothetical protein n=1 Tax=Aureliella helgolandensis TaxID=2527968 RepID=UPI0037042B4E
MRRRRDAGRTELEAYGDGLKTILCSPSFLYLPQPGGAPDAAVAARLSYFL